MFKPKNFGLRELLPEKFYNEMYPVYGDVLWKVFDEDILVAMQVIREMHGMMVVNTWYSQKMIDRYGFFESRGYRPHDDDDVQKSACPTYGNISQHRFGRAIDLWPVETTAAKIRQHMKDNPNLEGYDLITRVEETWKGKPIKWLHIDCANTAKTGIQFLKL